MVVVDTLTAELERSYGLEELQGVSRDLLGVDPSLLGAQFTLASFARALAEHCVRTEAVDALLDVMEQGRRQLPAELKTYRNGGRVLSERIPPGDSIDNWLLTRELGIGPCATIYEAHHGDQTVHLRLVHRHVAQHRRAVERYLTAVRAFSVLDLPSLVPVLQVPRQSERVWIATLPVEGRSLSEQLKTTGPKHLHELLPLFWAIAEVLASLHQAEHCHGAIHLGNVFAGERSGSSVPVWLADPGAHLLRPTLDLAGHRPEHAWLAACSPEQIGGEPPTPRSDVYAFGVLFYTLVAGKPPHEGTGVEMVAGHLSHEPEPLSLIAANRGATTEVDTLMDACLAKRPSERPADGIELLEVLRRLWRASTRPPSWAGAERLADRLAELGSRPWDEELASQLEASADLGADPLQLAQGFEGIAAQLEASGDRQFERPIAKLLVRSARLYDAAGAQNQAERVYAAIVDGDPNDGEAAQALDALRTKLGKFEELIESLLARSELAADARRRGELMGKIGDVYANNLHDTDQAVVAYAQALCEDPSNDVHVQSVERVAGSSGAAWQEVISSIMTAAQNAPTLESKVALLTHLGRWYTDKAGRPDHAAACFASVLELEPAHEPALRGLANVYRKAQQWVELGQVLLRWADVAAPNAARDMRAETASIAANQLGDPRSARDLFRTVIAEDPGHEAAVKGLSQLLSAGGERAEALSVLEGRARVLSGEARMQLLCEIAEGYELDLGDLDPAERHLRVVLAENPRYLPALVTLDRILSRRERFDELLANLQAQLELSATKRQKVSLLERIAAIYDEQFLEHDKAANALIEVLDLDPGRASAADELARHYRVLERWQDLAELLSQQYKQAGDDERKIDVGVKLGRVFEEQLNSPDHALKTFEAVLALDPHRPAALEGVARLSASTGDMRDALAALESLAEKAETPEKKSEQYARAARLLEDQGDEDGAIMRYKWALDANPTDPRWRRQLRDLYKKIKNFAAAAELLDEELEQTTGERAKGALAGELSLLCWRDLRDTERAQAAAKLALHCDPTNTDALRVVGNLAFVAGAFHEAGRRLEPVVNDLNALGDAAADTLLTYVEAMARDGAAQKALATALQNAQLFTDKPDALLRLAELSSEHGEPQATLRLCQTLLERHTDTLTSYEIAIGKLRVGKAWFAMGRTDKAQMALEQAVEADENNAEALTALADVYEKTNQHEAQIQTLYKKLNLVDSDEKVKMLLSIATIASNKLNNADYAAKSLLFALSERPNDRNILAKLVELYSAERDWPRLIRVITRLADVVDEPKHRAKYFHTAALIASRELRNDEEALELLGRAIDADPSCEPAMDLSLQLYRSRLDWDGLKRLLKLRAEQQSLEDDKAPLLKTLAELCDVYGNKLGRVDQAIAVAESALQIDPEQPAWVEQLARMYAADPVPHMEKALAHFAAWVRREPRRVVPYQLLRKVHTAARRADGAWLSSQALVALNRADPDELRFFERFRSQEPPNVRPMNQKDWLEFVMTSDGEPLLTALFALIQPSVVATRQVGLAESGLTEGHILDPSAYPYGLVLAASQAAAALSMPQPPFLQDPARQGRLGFLTTDPPSVLFAAGAFEEAMSATAAAFIAARHIAYYLPGLYLKQLLPNATSLKAHLFAALRLVKPTFPVAPDIENDVANARDSLKSLDATRRDHLSHLVNRVLSSGAPLDLKRWSRSVDLAADRTGLILCDDLPTAVEIIRNGGDRPGSPTAAERLEALLAYSVSPEFLRIRLITGVSIDG